MYTALSSLLHTLLSQLIYREQNIHVALQYKTENRKKDYCPAYKLCNCTQFVYKQGIVIYKIHVDGSKINSLND